MDNLPIWGYLSKQSCFTLFKAIYVIISTAQVKLVLWVLSMTMIQGLCYFIFFNVFLILELSLFRYIYNQLYLFPIGMTRNFLVNLFSYTTVHFGKPKIFEHVLLFMSMPFSHFYYFTIECRRLTGQNCFDFTLRCSSIGFGKTFATS